MKYLAISTVLATVIGFTFAGHVLAEEGEYYDGVSRTQDHLMVTTDSLGIPMVTRYGYPRMSIPHAPSNIVAPKIDSGDYFDGAVRPE
uniref:hypothetical protein n=1 Tax=Neorhizobium sp. EC2-8 TaxID=3129230 RepID=UPI003101AF95